MSTRAEHQPSIAPRPRLTVAEMLAAKGTRPIESVNDLKADTFSSDEEVDEFIEFYRAERQRDLS